MNHYAALTTINRDFFNGICALPPSMVSASNDRSPPFGYLPDRAPDRAPSARSSVEIGRYERVAAVGEHASDLLRQDAF
jgi:hypothetical protein